MSQQEIIQKNSSLNARSLLTLVTIGIVTLIIVIVIWTYKKPSFLASNSLEEHKENSSQHSEHTNKKEIELTQETLIAANIETVEVAEQEIVTTLKVTGTVEANQLQSQQASSLVSGRIEKINVVLGDYVKAGSILAMIISPQIAQMHGKLHEAETKYVLAERNLERVEKVENRVAVLSAKAKLNEAETTLLRVKKLVELEIAASKDLVAAETIYQTAKAEYDFQSNITLNREIAQAKAEVANAKVELSHIQDEMRAYGIPLPEEEHADHERNTALIPLHAPISGSIVDRMINAGAGVEVGKPLFTIANLSTVWVIANVAESQLNQIEIGSKVQINAAILGTEQLTGKVTYIDPRLNEETRTAQVRIELPNPTSKLKIGMFVEVGFLVTNTTNTKTSGLAIPSEAIQQIDQLTVVFVSKTDEPGHFEVRNVELGSKVNNGYQHIITGLEKGEKVVTKGSFALKTQLMKGALEEDHH